MADPTVKTVNVQVETGSTEHALLTGAKKTRRRRNANSTLPTPSSAASATESATSPEPVAAAAAAVKVTKTETATPSTPTPPALSPPPATVAPPAALNPPQPPKTIPPPSPAHAVKIAPKNGAAAAAQTPLTPAPRLLPKKRIGTAPAAETMKAKPKFVVEAPAPTAAKDTQKGGTSEPEAPTSGINRGSAVAAGGARSRTRRAFKERRINLTVQPVKKSRKYRRTLRARVAEMPIQQVRRMLLRKGVLKPKTDSNAAEKAPPEEMMRSMLVDYMMLHHAD